MRSPGYDHETLQSAIRSLFHDAGLGQVNSRNSLQNLISPGQSVLLKPNWVLHFNQSGQTMDCMVTHPAVIEAVLDEVLLAKPGRILIGDAPIQLCQFDKLVPEAWRKALQQRSAVPIEFVDFRRHCMHGSDISQEVEVEARPADRYVLFDLSRDSQLEPISEPGGRFRVTSYDPKALSQTHQPGRHQYLLCREAFEADVIINLPKLKTHRKTGITGALKNLVGLNGNKDYLPHHRVGGKALGGDCYAGIAPLKRVAEFCLDQANQRINTSGYTLWQRRAYRVLGWNRRFGDDDVEGSWHGNDTAWRMVLDLNRLLLYGCSDGSLAETPQRRVYSLTDAIIAGQGEGPLAPEPLELGVITFAASSAFAEVVHAALLGFDYRRLPVVREAFGRFRYPLTTMDPSHLETRLNGESIPLEALVEHFGVTARAPRGWAGHVERKRVAEVRA